MAMENGLQSVLLDSIFHRQLEQSTLPFGSSSPQKLKALVVDILEDRQQETLIARRLTWTVQTVDIQRIMLKSMMTRKEEQENVTSDSEHSSARRNPVPEEEVEETAPNLLEPLSEEPRDDDAALVRKSFPAGTHAGRNPLAKTMAATLSDSSETRRPGERPSTPTRSSLKLWCQKNESIANNGHQKDSCSRGVHCAFKHNDHVEVRTKEICSSGHQVRSTDNKLRGRQPEASKRLPFCVFFKEDNANQVRIAPSPT